MMKKLLFLVLSTSLTLVSCSDKETTLNGQNSTDRCLMSKDHKYEDLLTKADIAKHVDIDEGSYKMEISSIKGQYGYCKYEWLSDRPDLETDILGQIIKSPDKNHVKITQLDFYTDSELKLYQQADAIALFERAYKKINQQEYDELVEKLQTQYANDPTGFEEAKGFLDARLNLKYEAVSNLADRAYWKWHDQHGIELVVLTGAAHFEIVAKLSADAQTTLDASVKLAREVLAKCAVEGKS